MLHEVKDLFYRDRLEVNWKRFSLEEINSTKGPDWKVWDQDESYLSRGMPAFRATEAARRQGNALFERMHLAILKARFEENKNIADKSVLKQLAVAAGLDIPRWEKDYADPAILQSLAGDHTDTVQKYGTFGVPTIFPGNGHGFYLKLTEIPRGQEALETFETLVKTMVRHPYIQELKQPNYPKKD